MASIEERLQQRKNTDSSSNALKRSFAEPLAKKKRDSRFFAIDETPENLRRGSFSNDYEDDGI